MTVGFYFDMTRCIGCRACQVVCKDKNRLEVGTLYREVHSFTVGQFPEVKSYSHTFSCNHCEDPICLKNCPTGAIYKAPDGTVIQDQSKCIGCRMCVMSCPYGQPKYFPEKGVSGKCDGCRMFTVGSDMACVKQAVSLHALQVARTVRWSSATWTSCAASTAPIWTMAVLLCCRVLTIRIRTC